MVRQAPGDWFVYPCGLSLSAADGSLWVTDEGGGGGGLGRGRLQRLARRGALLYDPLTREYSEQPNDYVRPNVLHTQHATVHVRVRVEIMGLIIIRTG
jgi:hypothetical protein